MRDPIQAALGAPRAVWGVFLAVTRLSVYKWAERGSASSRAPLDLLLARQPKPRQGLSLPGSRPPSSECTLPVGVAR